MFGKAALFLYFLGSIWNLACMVFFVFGACSARSSKTQEGVKTGLRKGRRLEFAFPRMLKAQTKVNQIHRRSMETS